jgi:hypothetical protein
LEGGADGAAPSSEVVLRETMIEDVRKISEGRFVYLLSLKQPVIFFTGPVRKGVAPLAAESSGTGVAATGCPGFFSRYTMYLGQESGLMT